jgi:hypothetical protein
MGKKSKRDVTVGKITRVKIKWENKIHCTTK